MRKKALSPACRRAYALKAVEGGLGSGRKVCRVLEVPRSSYWYRPKEKTPWERRLLKRMVELSDKYPRYGYRRSLTQLNDHTLKELQHFFEVYKQLEEKAVEIHGWREREDALGLIEKYRTDRSA